MKYIINEALSITLNKKGQATIHDTACLLAAIAGLRHDPDASQGAANIFVGEDGTHYWIPKPVAAGITPDYSEFANMMQLAPHKNPAFCHVLMRKLGLIVSPVLLDGGHLAGQWRVEYVTFYGVTDFKNNGWTFGENEPVSETSQNLFEAICRTAIRVAGVGRKAYLLRESKDSNDAKLIYLSDWCIDWIAQNTTDAERLQPVPALDAYAVCGISEEDAKRILENAIAESKANAEAAPAPVPSAESSAPTTNEPAPEGSAPATAPIE
ncbi:hypothetical protein O3W44_22420 [Pantoea sp. LMR881]|uniref:hypothetical protein n=1 Tax=Pantoea sp. LMR881 TaxID=3014336 RepID=UPI0022B048F7|nr:hypothetical protein [Pantoea sp. LMR881]MCZ4061178.1 hypothetical protein [Pantoea sp. LMR881]MCZ4061289.1 hypothetical protein [Pantoea sp. LMR881]